MTANHPNKQFTTVKFYTLFRVMSSRIDHIFQKMFTGSGKHQQDDQFSHSHSLHNSLRRIPFAKQKTINFPLLLHIHIRTIMLLLKQLLYHSHFSLAAAFFFPCNQSLLPNCSGDSFLHQIHLYFLNGLTLRITIQIIHSIL